MCLCTNIKSPCCEVWHYVGCFLCNAQWLSYSWHHEFSWRFTEQSFWWQRISKPAGLLLLQVNTTMLNMDFDTFTVFYDIVVNAFLALLPFVYCFWLMDMAMDVILVILVTYIGRILCIGFCLQQLLSRL